MALSLRFSRLSDGRVLDFLPMDSGKPALVFDPKSPDGGWAFFEGTFGDAWRAVPLTVEEERELIGESEE